MASREHYPGRVEAAALRVAPDPTPPQRRALNYRHGPAHLHGLSVMIAYPAGSTQEGPGEGGARWSRVLRAHYGRLKRTVGVDGDPVNVFVGPEPDSPVVFVVSQLGPRGDLDEHKVVLGCRGLAEARELYLAHYPPGWAQTRLGEVRGMALAEFRRWLDGPHPYNRRARAKASADASAEADLAAGALAAILARAGA